MKIHPPTLAIDTKEPFKDALFGRKDFALSLTSLLRNTDDNLVVFVNATWGQGKSTFVQMWRQHLANEKLDVIHYDAFASDYFDDPFVSFSGEILALVKKRLAAEKGIEDSQLKFRKAAVTVGKQMVGAAVKIGIRAATAGLIQAGDLAELKDSAEDAMKEVSDAAAEYVEKRIENYAAEKDGLTEFKRSLAELAKTVRETQGFPLTIIVDELDRCRPAFALGLLERIKHLFDVENVCFVLLVNRLQIEQYVKNIYGENDAAAFLLKFGTVFVDLPTTAPKSQYLPGRDVFCRTLLVHFDLSLSDGEKEAVFDTLHLCSEQLGLTLREIEKTFAALALYFGSAPDSRRDSVLAPMLAAIRVKHPQLYEKLARGEASASEFFDRTGLHTIITRLGYLDPNYIIDSLKFALLSDEEWAQAPEGRRNDMRSWYGIAKRRELIPMLCRDLNRFSMKA